MSDVTHENHIGKTILAARNYRCADQSADAFETKALEVFKKYRDGREGKEGKRTQKLFEEHIYSSAPQSFLADKEKTLVEKAIIDNAFPFTSCRTVWHDDPETGRSDLHILSTGYTDDVPPRCHLSTDFGHGKRDFLLTLERAERDALDLINQNREPNRKILSAREVKEKKMKEAEIQTLGEKLSGIWDGSRETLIGALEKLEYQITKLTEKNVSVKAGKGKVRRYNLETLREDVEEMTLEKVRQPERRESSKISLNTKIEKWKKKFKGELPQEPTRGKKTTISQDSKNIKAVPVLEAPADEIPIVPDVPVPEKEKPKKKGAWKATIDWDAEAKKNKDKPD